VSQHSGGSPPFPFYLYRAALSSCFLAGAPGPSGSGSYAELRLYGVLGSWSDNRPYGAWLCPDPGARLPAVLELLEAVFLGVVQGLTEFLPVSSSGHLLLSQYFLGMDQERFGLSFDAAIHTGTLLAAVLFFRGDLLAMARAFLGSLPHPDFADAQVRMAYLILLATVPGALIGFFFEDFFAKEVRSPWVVVINLVFVGALFLAAEAVGRKTESAIKLGPLGPSGSDWRRRRPQYQGSRARGRRSPAGCFWA
jgi:undecaprenyl-diphosphatase